MRPHASCVPRRGLAEGALNCAAQTSCHAQAMLLVHSVEHHVHAQTAEHMTSLDAWNLLLLGPLSQAFPAGDCG